MIYLEKIVSCKLNKIVAGNLIRLNLDNTSENTIYKAEKSFEILLLNDIEI